MPPAPPTLPMQVESSSITTTELLQVGEQVHSPLSTVEQPLSRKNKPRKSKKKPKNNVDTHRTSAPLVQHSATSEVNTGAPLFDKNPHLIPANTPDSAGPFPENKSKFDNEKVFTEADLRPRSAATENANSSPTSGYPSSPEMTARLEHLHHYSRHSSSKRTPYFYEARRRPTRCRGGTAIFLGDPLREIRKYATVARADAGGGQHPITVTSSTTGSRRTERAANGNGGG